MDRLTYPFFFLGQQVSGHIKMSYINSVAMDFLIYPASYISIGLLNLSCFFLLHWILRINGFFNLYSHSTHAPDHPSFLLINIRCINLVTAAYYILSLPTALDIAFSLYFPIFFRSTLENPIFTPFSLH